VRSDSEHEPGEGSLPHESQEPLTRLAHADAFARHPLPQGERGRKCSDSLPVAPMTHGAKLREKTYPPLLQRPYIQRALFAAGVISSDVAMAERGAARRQRVPLDGAPGGRRPFHQRGARLTSAQWGLTSPAKGGMHHRPGALPALHSPHGGNGKRDERRTRRLDSTGDNACPPLVITGLVVPVIPLRKAQCVPKRDGRVIGERSDAVLWTAMPGHDKLHVKYLSTIFR
jgi:hypothetical protein